MNMNSDQAKPKGVRLKLTPYAGKELPVQFWINAVMYDQNGITLDQLSEPVKRSCLAELNSIVDSYTTRGMPLHGTTIQMLRRLTSDHPLDFYGHVHGLIK
jgi:hypothetical protein